jgi:hypothetical protein
MFGSCKHNGAGHAVFCKQRFEQVCSLLFLDIKPAMGDAGCRTGLVDLNRDGMV